MSFKRKQNDLDFVETDDSNHERFFRDSDEDTEDASETDMVKQEEEYTEIKEQVYQDQLANLKQQLELHMMGSHPDFLKGCKELQKALKDRQLHIEVQKKLELERVEREYEEEIKAIHEDYEKSSVQLKQNLIGNLEKERRLVDVEYTTLDLSSDSLEAKQQQEQSTSTRKLRSRTNDPPSNSNKKKKEALPLLNFLLDDDDIDHDLKQMKIKPFPQHKERSCRSPMAPVTPGPNENSNTTSSEIKVQDGKLYYNRKWYCRGQSIYVEEKGSRSKTSAVISSINSSELWIKKTSENSKIKITVSQLQKGEYAVSKRNI